MRQKLYQIDAFTDKVFAGNPAAVCPLEQWLSDDLMQKIAMENNLAETAFYIKAGDQYHIRWFTPTVEVDLCGHATLATAFAIFTFENPTANKLNFFSPRSGELTVLKRGDLLTLNFPSDVFHPTEVTAEIERCFNIKPITAFKGKTDYMLVFRDETEISSAIPALGAIARLNARGVIITAKGNQVDFVSRFFGPQSGVDEDPVTGSAHTTLTPYWARELGKNVLTAMQLSARKGYLQCSWLGDRVEISGKCQLYLTGEIQLD
jgi:PhzF family phenazine biosynthesis protein